MKRLLISTLALVLLAAVPAAGAPNDRHHRGGNPQAQSRAATHVRANPAKWQARTPRASQGAIRSRAVWSGRGRAGSRNAVGAGYSTRNRSGSSNRTTQTNWSVRHRESSGRSGNTSGGTAWSVRHRERSGYPNSNWTGRSSRSSLHNISDRRDNNRHRGNYGRSNRSSNPVMEPRHNRPQNWNARPRHFDFHAYRRNYDAPRRFHWHAYNRPHGWYAHRWTYGETLPRIFWVRDYWVSDWWEFDLAQPPYGYEWVRYGDDALLVNIETGEVLQVEYDLFD